MPEVNLGAFDLNLLLVFDAMMQERSVTLAGSRIGLSQPAMSHALNRLRQRLDDDLFVRTPSGMVPTPRAEMLALPLRNALAEVRLALEPGEFEPITAERRFTLAFNNYAALLLAPPLFAAVGAAAPGISLDIVPRGTMDLPDHLDRGDVDLALEASQGGLGDRFGAAPLLEDRIVMLMRRDHPAAEHEISARDMANLRHVDTTSALDDTRFIAVWLAKRGLTMDIAARAPFISVPHILAQSDLVASMSLRVAQHLARSYPLTICEPPYVSPPVYLTMHWHKRLDRHPAHRWLRETIRSVALSL